MMTRSFRLHSGNFVNCLFIVPCSSITWNGSYAGNQSWFGILQYPDINTHIAFFDLQHEIGARLLTMDQVPKKMAILGWPHYHRHDLPKFWACKKRLYNIEMDPNVVTIGRCRILAASLCEDECMLSYTAIPFLPSWATDRFFGLGGLFSRM